MKKIVALVLTLVLALSLATVAFAAEDTVYFGTSVDAGPLKVGLISLENTKYYTLSLEKVKEANEDYHTVDQFKVFLSITGTDVSLPLPGVFVEATSDDADFVFVTGKHVKYLSQYLLGAYTGEATAIETVSWEKYNAKPSKVPCGAYVSDEALYKYDGKVMKAFNPGWSEIKDIKAIALVDGKLVTLTTATNEMVPFDYIVVDHTYVADWAMVGGELKVSAVTCDNCGEKFDFVVGSKTDATKAFGAGNFKMIEIDDELLLDALDEDEIYISTATAGTAADGNKDVKSATTFDAGVALYAGMALMSVAGSAVVIGKKKEF